ncbi:MAG: SDR family oxidoreductase [Phycisphaerae bacterium]|nr:SDR family oxidoreductase [Phycisphaerae bacterium]
MPAADATAPRRLALVTGASAGIGESFAELLAERGFDLCLVARRLDRLESLAGRLAKDHGVEASAIAADLADPEAPERVVRAVADRGRAVDVLVNNAGYGLRQRFADASWSAQSEFLAVMTRAPLHLMRLVLPGMLARRWGRIVNVASLAAFAAEPPGSTYPATKQFLVSASRGIWLAHRRSGVHVTASCPGFTTTEFHDVLGVRESMNSLPRFMWQSSRAVVEESWRAVERNQPVVVTGAFNKVLAAAMHFLPFRLAARLTPRAIRDRAVMNHPS